MSKRTIFWMSFELNFTSSSHACSLSFLHFTPMSAPAVVKKGLPKIIGMDMSAFMSNIQQNPQEWSICQFWTSTFSSIPNGYLTDLLTNCDIILVSLSSFKPNCLAIVKGIKDILALRSEFLKIQHYQ